MNNNEFEQFVLDNGKDILRFCRMTTKDEESGSELYQDTMLKLLEKCEKLDPMQNIKSYAISISILLWKNKKRKYATRNRIAPTQSYDEYIEGVNTFESSNRDMEHSPEQYILKKSQIREVQDCVAMLPEKYRIPIYLRFSANMGISEIAESLHIPVGTVKSRIRKAKILLKKKLEDLGYDG